MNAMRVGLLVLCAALAGCTTRPHDVESAVVSGALPLPIQSFAVHIDGMPGFLVPYFREELVGVMANLGAEEVASGADVEFTLRYTGFDLPQPEAPLDVFGEQVSNERPARFIAQVTLEARRAGVDEPVLVATLSRAHQVTVGAYMHPRSRAAIRSAYQRIFGIVQ